jgi:tRNA(Ser,Leu) C12 N-acetylase TAN1
MLEWNVVMCTAEGGFNRALRFLKDHGAVARTAFHNILVLRAEDPSALMETLRAPPAEPGSALFTRVVPVSRTFSFQNRLDFEAQAGRLAGLYAGRVAGRCFHVRMHRRGFKGRLHSVELEKHLCGILLALTQQAGNPVRIGFDDPDAVLAVETIGNQAGLSLWTREALRRYPLLRLT